MRLNVYKAVMLAMFGVVFCCLIGCFGGIEYSELTPPPPLIKPEIDEIRLKAGDSLTILFYYHPELQNIQTVRDDGKIFLQLIGEVDVKGLTPLELKHKLEKEYNRYIDRVSASVMINSIAPNKIYLCGAVGVTQVLGYTGDITVFQAIIRSGGGRGTGRLDNVLVIRDQGTLAPKVFKVDVEASIRKKGRDFVLENHDVVYIPTRMITKINQFVVEYIDGIIPRHVASSFGFGYTLGGSAAKGEADININVNGF